MKTLAKMNFIADACRRYGATSEELIPALTALSNAARQVPFPALREIGTMRLRLLVRQFGPLCILMPSAWRWGWMAVFDR